MAIVGDNGDIHWRQQGDAYSLLKIVSSLRSSHLPRLGRGFEFNSLLPWVAEILNVEVKRWIKANELKTPTSPARAATRSNPWRADASTGSIS
jgi:hypothetical protein